jgi:hypothetical protein
MATATKPWPRHANRAREDAIMTAATIALKARRATMSFEDPRGVNLDLVRVIVAQIEASAEIIRRVLAEAEHEPLPNGHTNWPEWLETLRTAVKEQVPYNVLERMVDTKIGECS